MTRPARRRTASSGYVRRGDCAESRRDCPGTRPAKSALLTNQIDLIAGGDATTATDVTCAANYLVPFIVSNVGLVIGRATP